MSPTIKRAALPGSAFMSACISTMQASQKYTRRFDYPVGDHRALLKLEIERSADELLRTSSSFSARGINSSVGKPQCPSSMAQIWYRYGDAVQRELNAATKSFSQCACLTDLSFWRN
jgi:hypothetical protein